MKSPKKISIVSMAGHNLGDDAILQSLVDSIQRIGGEDIILSVALLKKIKLPIEISNFLVINRRKISFHLKLIHLIIRSDIVVIGGGSIIQDDFGSGYFTGITSLYFEVAILCKFLRRRMITAPIGVDDLNTKVVKTMAKYILLNSDFVFVRDLRSQANVYKITGGGIKCILSADPVFNFEPEKSLTKYLKRRLIVTPAYEGRNEDKITADIAKLISISFENGGFDECVLIPMDSRINEDGGGVQCLFNSLPTIYKDKTTIASNLSVPLVVELIRSSSLLLTMRLHPIIIGYGYLPIFCVSRGVKTESICKELGVSLFDYQTKSSDSILCDVYVDYLENARVSGNGNILSNRYKDIHMDLRARYREFENFFSNFSL